MDASLCSVCLFILLYSISAYHHWSCEFESCSGEVYLIQHYVIKCQWFSCTLVSSTNKTDHHDITKILLKVALNTKTLTHFIIKLKLNVKKYWYCKISFNKFGQQNVLLWDACNIAFWKFQWKFWGSENFPKEKRKEQRNVFSVYYSILQLKVKIIYILCDFLRQITWKLTCSKKKLWTK